MFVVKKRFIFYVILTIIGTSYFLKMTYTATISSKGQIVIPAKLRKKLKLKAHQKIVFEIKNNSDEITLKAPQDILDLAGTFKPKKIVPATELRDIFENHYERC